MDPLREVGLGLGWSGRWAWPRPCWLLVIHADQDLEAVTRDNALAPMQRAEPPAIQALGVPLQHRHDVTLSEGELIRGLSYIVIEGFGQHVLGREDIGGHEGRKIGTGLTQLPPIPESVSTQL